MCRRCTTTAPSPTRLPRPCDPPGQGEGDHNGPLLRLRRDCRDPVIASRERCETQGRGEGDHNGPLTRLRRDCRDPVIASRERCDPQGQGEGDHNGPLPRLRRDCRDPVIVSRDPVQVREHTGATPCSPSQKRQPGLPFFYVPDRAPPLVVRFPLLMFA